MGKLKKAQKFLEGIAEKHGKDFAEAGRYAESFSRAAEEHFGLPNPKKKSKQDKIYDDLLK